jgi:tetratricopeptide (TPR) repeat protein
MTRSRRITMAASAMLILSMAISILLLRRIDDMRTGATLEEVLFVSSPKALKRMSLGYEGLVADIYWTRAVQYFGDRHHAGASDYKLLGPLLEITTALDPKLLVAYDYGSSFLAPKAPGGAGEPQRAIDLVKYGIAQNPNHWKLYYELGFIYYMDLKDYAGAADAFTRGSEIPNAHPFMKLLAAQMAQHAGERQTARMMWTATYQTATQGSIRANAAAHLRALQVDDDVTALENAIQSYKQKTGHLPASFSEMQVAGILRGIPIDPLGHPYKLSSDGRVELRTPDDFPFIEKGTPPGYKPPLAPKFLPTD